jgi:beta-lactamase class A
VLRLLLLLAALAAPDAHPAGPVHIVTPRPYEVWDGRVAGRVRPGVRSILVTAGDGRWAVLVGADGRFDGTVGPLRPGEARVSVAGRDIDPVWALPSGSLVPLEDPADNDDLDRRLHDLAGETTPHVGIFAHCWNGIAGTYNAAAEFEAASTLKLPIVLTLVAKTDGELSDSPYWDPITRITRYSDNAAANDLLEAVAGTEPAGAAEMVAFMRSLGLRHTYMAGGYLTGYGGGPPVMTVDDPPPTAYKHTTAGDMATLAADLASAAAGRGPLLGRGITIHEARELLFLMVQAEDPGLVKAGAGGLPVAHKIGWLDDTNNDVAIVFTRRGPVAIAIYTNGTQDGSAQEFGKAATQAVLATAHGRT